MTFVTLSPHYYPLTIAVGESVAFRGGVARCGWVRDPTRDIWNRAFLMARSPDAGARNRSGGGVHEAFIANPDQPADDAGDIVAGQLQRRSTGMPACQFWHLDALLARRHGRHRWRRWRWRRWWRWWWPHACGLCLRGRYPGRGDRFGCKRHDRWLRSQHKRRNVRRNSQLLGAKHSGRSSGLGDGGGAETVRVCAV